MPISKEEFFNMKHSAARNVIERSFGVLKMRFVILRSPSYYPIRTQCHIVSACCLLHNLIKREMPNDPIEHEYTAWERAHVNDVPVDDNIANVESSNEWTAGRDALAAAMYNHCGVERPTKQKRRSWRKREEDALMKCMLTEAAERRKADNGFKTGYFTHLEKELEKVLPGCNLKANPHIDSKVRYWKCVWAKIVDITNLSGYGWDAVNKRIDVDQVVWDAYEKANPKKAQGLYGKSFPYFEDWQTIFGKDRATGAAAEDYDEMARPDIPNESMEPHNSNDFYDALFDNYDQHLPNSPTTPVTPHVHSPKVNADGQCRSPKQEKEDKNG
ncbi:uncharacterized protein LOC131328428 [Rhododendron vialii]|uniref:uncharacterized protein LOC131328428 n=1 Tax=Rhododendron vialii TaxID=182163 RepID=UPI002660087C|nr:uncharacterized protein LOC131328428 [Rhododendron vialii]